MKKNYKFTILVSVISMGIFAQVGTNFEESYGGTSDYIDLDFSTIHELDNHNNPQASVKHVSTGGELGFTTTFTPTRTGTSGTTGLSDGDAVGVHNNFTVISSTDVGFWNSGNAYIIEDSDGMITVEFDKVSLSGTATPRFQMTLWVDVTSYEVSNGGNDRIYIGLEIDDGATVIDVIDSDGGGSGGGASGDLDLAIHNGFPLEGTITNIDVDLSMYIGSSVKLIIEADFDSGSEKVIFDNILFTEGAIVDVLNQTTYTTPKIQLYPNPADNQLTFTGLANQQNFIIYNSLGTIVKSGVVKNQASIDIANLVKGVYCIQLENNRTIRFIKK